MIINWTNENWPKWWWSLVFWLIYNGYSAIISLDVDHTETFMSQLYWEDTSFYDKSWHFSEYCGHKITFKHWWNTISWYPRLNWIFWLKLLFTNNLRSQDLLNCPSCTWVEGTFTEWDGPQKTTQIQTRGTFITQPGRCSTSDGT